VVANQAARLVADDPSVVDDMLETLATVRRGIEERGLVAAVNEYSHAEVMTDPFIRQALERFGARARRRELQPGDARELLDVLISVGVVIEKLGLQDLVDAHRDPVRGPAYQDLLRAINIYSPPRVH
jgi:hypothetical protein